jgi:hypothetical protein
MGQEQPTPNYNDQPDLDRTQPSPSQPPRRLDWRPAAYQSGGEGSDQEAPPVRRVPRPGPSRRRPPTEGAPTWVVGLGAGALLAVILLLVVAFVFSRRSAQPEPTPTVMVVTPTATLIPRPTATPPAVPTDTPEAAATAETPAAAPPSDTIGIGGYVRIAAPAGLSFRETPSTGGALIQVLDSGSVLEVVGGPQEADGYTWWQLRRDDGKDGWSAAGSGEDVFLEPAPVP